MKRPTKRGWPLPREFARPPYLDPDAPAGPMKRNYGLLINPFYRKDEHASFGKHVLTPTLALTSVAGATPDSWRLRYWDENLLQGPPPLDPFPQVVGITVHLTFAYRAYELARWFRTRGAIVILGGLHALSCEAEVAQHADIVAVGDGVELWPRILRDVGNGRYDRIYRAGFKRPYRDDPAPRRDLVSKRDFLTTTSVIATRGCHNRCDFCYLSTEGLHMPYRLRDVEQVIAEIRSDGQPYAVFTDNNLGSRPDYLRRLCAALEPLGIISSAAVTIDVTDDPSLVRDMALSGCTGVFVGFESLELGNLKAARKRTPPPHDYARRVDLLHRNGIQVNGSFVLGFDYDDEMVFERTVDWIEASRLECATFHILTPYPGTPLFARLDRENRLLHKNWELYDTAHVVFRPARLSVEELAAGYAWCYQRLFSHGSIWRRRPDDPRAVLPYLAMSYLYKRSNPVWHRLIRHRLTSAVWRPLIELSRQRHLRFRSRLAATNRGRGGSVVSAGV